MPPWLSRLSTLKAARTAARGIAPHKPLMLLTVIDLIESGDVPDGWVRYDVRLVSRFRDYWELVARLLTSFSSAIRSYDTAPSSRC
jgi:putative restriction endonuclease